MMATTLVTVERESYTLVNKSVVNLVSQKNKNSKYDKNIENSFKKHMQKYVF